MANPSKINIYFIMIFIFLFPIFSSKDSNLKKEKAQYLIVSIKGELRLEDENGKLIWSNSIGKPLIKTDINVNNINFLQTNILPSMNGGLFLVNERQNLYELLDVNFEDLIKEPPSIFNQYISGTFYRSVKEKYFAINILNGDIIKIKKGNSIDNIIKGNLNNNNSNDTDNYIIMKRINYIFQVRKDYAIVWNANFGKLEILSKGNSKIFHPMTNSIEDNVIHRNMKNNTYIFKYIVENNELILMKIHNSNNSPYTFNYKQMNEINFFTKKKKSIYYNYLIFTFTILITSMFLFQISDNKIEKQINQNEKEKEKEKEKENIKKEIESNESKLKIENSTSAKNISQLSTYSTLKNSLDEFPIKNKSFHLCSRISLNHKESAPESEFQHKKLHKELFNDEKNNILNSLYGNDESLALNKNYQMKKISNLYKRHSLCEENSINNIYLVRKLSDNISSKRKFHPSKKDLEELNKLTIDYLENTRKQSSDSLNKIGRFSNNKLNYDEIYKIINSNSNDSNSENDENPIPPELMSKSNFSLCDTGRFLKDFENIQFIGKGGFGSVFKATHIIDGGIYAIKIIKSNLGIDDELEQLNEVQEIKTMLKVEHKNIVRYITCWFETINYYNKRSRAFSMDEKYSPQKKDFGCVKNKIQKKIQKDTKLPLSRIQSIANEFEYISDDSYKDLKNKDSNNYNNSDLYNDDENDSFSRSFQLKLNQSNSLSDDGIIFTDSKGNSNNKNNTINNNNNNNNEHIINFPDNESEIKSPNNKKLKKELSRKVSDSIMNSLRKTYKVYFYMQMEYCEGIPLSYYIQQRKKVSNESLIIHIFYQICNAVQHIHSKSIIHRDLKPANIFMNKKFKIKIIDFGLASEKYKKNEENVGTYLYLSPEQLARKPYNEKVDIYALGIILIEMCCFFNTKHERINTLKEVINGVYPEKQMKCFENELKLVKKLTKFNPNERPNIEEVINSEEMKLMLEMI